MSHLDPDVSLEPNWTDLRVPVTSTKLGGSKDPTFGKIADDGAGSQGVFAYSFSASQEKELYFVTQMPHGWKIGTDIDLHVHWSPSSANAGTVRWGCEYSIVNEGDLIAPTAIVTADAVAGGAAATNQLDDIAFIDMSSAGLSAIIMARVFRDVGGGSYPDAAFLLEIDFHYQQDTLGSNEEYSKGTP